MTTKYLITTLLIVFIFQLGFNQVTSDELVVLKNIDTDTAMEAISNPLSGHLIYNQERESVYVFDGTNWKNTSYMHTPFVTNHIAETVAVNQTKTIIIEGTDFRPETTVSIPGFGGTINSTTVVSPIRIELNITADGTTGFYDFVLTTNGKTNTSWTGNGENKLEITN